MTEDQAEYSQVAEEQLDELEHTCEAVNDFALYNNVLNAIDKVLNEDPSVRSSSAAISTDRGIKFRYAILGSSGWKIFWYQSSDGGPVIDAVMRYPT